MPAQIAVDYPYYYPILERLKKMEKKNKQLHWQPSTREHIKGGLRDEIHYGNKPVYPMYDNDELYEINNMKYKRPPLQAGSNKHKRPYKVVGPKPDENLHNHQVKLLRKIHNIHMSGGNVKQEVKRIAKKYGPTVLSGLLDLAPGAAGLLGSMVGSPAAGVVASAATGVARKAIKNYTGYGKPKKGKGIKKVVKAVLPPVLDVLPGLAGLAGSAYGGPATGTAAHIMGKLGREGIRHMTGYGKPKKGKGIKKVVQKAIPHVLDVAVPALFSYNEHDPNSFQHPENYGASKGHVMGHIVRKGIKYMTGYGRKGKLSEEEYELGKLLVDDIRNQHKKLGMSGGAITDFSDSVKDYIKNKLVEGIKYSSLAIAKYICRDLGISTSHAHRISEIITKFFEAGTGLIVNSKYQYGSGHPKNHKSVKMEGKKRQTHSNNSSRRQQRNELVRKLMQEHGMKLGEASRYIKENNLM